MNYGLAAALGIFVVSSAVAQTIGVPTGAPVRGALAVSEVEGRVYRIHGRATSIDPVNRTFTVASKSGSRIVAVFWGSAIIKNGTIVSLSSAAIGDEVDGIIGNRFGKLISLSVRFGAYRKNLPAGVPIKGHPGYVTSPYSPHAGFVEVTGMPTGMEVKDPYSNKVFLVP